MEERDQLLIERYLANELSETERAEVERRQKEDPLFLRELTEYEMAMKALQVRQREELRERFKVRDIKLDSGSSDAKETSRFNFGWIWIAVIAMLGLLLWKLFFPAVHQPTQVSSDIKDSLHVKDQPYVIDTSAPSEIMQNENTPREVDKNQTQDKQELKEEKKKGEEIFAENFEPYKDETMSPVSRGDESISPLDQFRQYYWDGRYGQAVIAFSTLSAKHQENDNMRFQYALSLMAINKLKEAQSILQSIIDHKLSIYLEEAHWYLGLVYLKQGDFQMAKKYFQYCVDSPEGFNKQEAAEILKELK